MKKYIAYIIAIMKGRILHKNIPVFVTLCITNRCNLKCIYCYGEYYNRNHRDFTTGQLIDLIEELSKMGTKYISLNGGEALLREDIEAIVDKVKEKNMFCHLSTNGLLIKNNIPVLRKVDSIAISIDGAKESNDSNRGTGVYERIIEGIECLVENHIRFHTHTVLTKNNKNALKEMIALALKYGFKAQFSTLRIEESSNKQINLDGKELKVVIQEILKYKKTGLPVFFSYEAYKNILNWPFSYDRQFIFEVPKGYKPIKCYLKRFSCHIEANGLVYPCIVLVNKLRTLNFLEVGFQKAWENSSSIECMGCYNVCCNDFNLIFGFKPASLWNACRIIMARNV